MKLIKRKIRLNLAGVVEIPDLQNVVVNAMNTVD